MNYTEILWTIGSAAGIISGLGLLFIEIDRHIKNKANLKIDVKESYGTGNKDWIDFDFKILVQNRGNAPTSVSRGYLMIMENAFPVGINTKDFSPVDIEAKKSKDVNIRFGFKPINPDKWPIKFPMKGVIILYDTFNKEVETSVTIKEKPITTSFIII